MGILYLFFVCLFDETKLPQLETEKEQHVYFSRGTLKNLPIHFCSLYV
jgi:hypothetical protein